MFEPVDDAKPAYKVEINRIDKEPLNREGVTDLMHELKAALGKSSSATVGSNTLSLLEGDGNYLAGDFRSKECVELLNQADIVVTNPPFSLFREYVKQLVDYDKKFLILGNKNAVTYKEIFPLIMQNKAWTGYRPFTGGMWFISIDENNFDKEINGKKLKNASAIWFTNLEHDKRNRPYDLVFSYKENPARYPKYDNYDAIEVSKTGDIPEDYFGVMGVPITFLDKYCPTQFEIFGHTSSSDLSPAVEALRTDPKNRNRGIINGRQKYDRILIRRKR